jgi:hypothetical protein
VLVVVVVVVTVLEVALVVLLLAAAVLVAVTGKLDSLVQRTLVAVVAVVQTHQIPTVEVAAQVS